MAEAETKKGSKVKTNRRDMDMIHGSIWNKLLIFALPLAATGILQQLFNAADIAVVGRFVGTNAMAAVGSCAPVVGLLVNIFVGLSLGSNVVIARFTGQRDSRNVRRAVHTSILLALLIGIGIAVIGQLITAPMLDLLSVPEEVKGMAALYLRILFAGMPFTSLYNFEAGIFRSQGNTRIPLICLAISGSVNVCLNLFFVIVLGMDVNGVALATVSANALSAVLLFILLHRSRGAIRVRVRHIRIYKEHFSSIVRIGLPAAIQGMVFSLSNLLIQNSINQLGPDTIAGSSAAFNIEILTYFIINSFGQACTTFVGQNYGAGKIARTHKVLKQSILLDLTITFAVSMIILLFSGQLLSIFNKDPNVIAVGKIRLLFILTTQLLNVIIECMSGFMRGFGYSMIPAVIAFVGICGVRILWLFTAFRAFPAFRTLMIAYPVSWVITSAALIAAYFVLKKRINKKGLVPAES